MAEIKTDRVSKSYGGLEAVREVSFSAKSGEFVVLLGPSGSGKTTLLKCIAGLETPDEGDVLVDGESVRDVPPRERDISMVFQNYALFPQMSVGENIAFPLRVRGEPEGSVRKRVGEVGELLGISKVLGKLPRDLSGGEQQRVAIGRAIVRKTKALLMDEPLSNLDAPLRAQLRTDLKTLQRELGVTVIYVTHDQVEAMTLADKMGVIEDGRLVQFGTPREIYDNPASSFVARFVGTPGANLVEVVVEAKGDQTLLRGSGVDFVVPSPLSRKLSANNGKKLTLAVRPEDIALREARGPETFETEVELIEDLGATKILDLRAGKLLLKALVPTDFSVSVRSRLWAAVDFDRAHLYDDSSGASIWPQ